jgi:predicted nucleic acid-binding protein
MSRAYVFDTEAIIAFLYDEPRHERVASLLDDVEDEEAEGLLAELNASEVYYLVARFEGTDDDNPTSASLRLADRDIRALERRGLVLEQADWRRTGEIKADGHISLADAAAVALAHEHDSTLVTGGDDDFDSLPVDISIDQFRDHGV